MYAAGRKVKRLSADDKTALKAAHRELIYDAETSPCSSFALIECPSCIFSDQCEYSTKYKYYINNCDPNPKFEIYHSRERVTFVFRSAFNCYSIAGEKLDPNEFHLMLLPCGRFTVPRYHFQTRSTNHPPGIDPCAPNLNFDIMRSSNYPTVCHQ